MDREKRVLRSKTRAADRQLEYSSADAYNGVGYTITFYRCTDGYTAELRIGDQHPVYDDEKVWPDDLSAKVAMTNLARDTINQKT